MIFSVYSFVILACCFFGRQLTAGSFSVKCNVLWKTKDSLGIVRFPLSLSSIYQIVESWESNEGYDSTSFFDAEADIETTETVAEFRAWQKSVNDAVVNLDKKTRSLQKELEKIGKVQELQERANLITAYMFMFTPGVRSIVVQDWEQNNTEVQLTLSEEYRSAADEANAIYEQARRLKRGSKTVRPLLEITENAMEILLQLQNTLNTVCSVDGNQLDDKLFRETQAKLILSSKLLQFSPPSSASSLETKQSISSREKDRRQKKPVLGSPASNVRKFVTDAGSHVFVGRNRRGNEYISFTLAGTGDVWMHARGIPGAHVLIKNSRFATISDDCIQLGANLAAFYSDARTDRKVLVSAAEPKHILKPRGAPLGTVKLREELFVRTGFPEDIPKQLEKARN